MSNSRPVNSNSFFNASVTTTVSIALVLFLLGLTLLTGFMGKEITSFMKENVGLSIELPDNMNEVAISKLQKQLDESSFVRSATFISKEEIKENLIEDLGRDPEEILGYNPLYNCFEIKLNPEYANPDSLKVVESGLRSKNLIKNFIYSEDDLKMVNANLSKIGTGLFIIAVLLMFVSFTLIRNTIRLNIYSKRFLINTMQLVGATNSFIRKPFILRTVVCGVFAAIFANIAITGLVYYFTREYPELISILKTSDLILLYLVVLVMGILITAWATASAVNRYLKMKTNNLYHI